MIQGFNEFEFKLRNAAAKLRRAADNENRYDPVSGFSTDEIVKFIVDLPALGNEEQLAQSRAVLRRNGFTEEAESFSV